MIFKIYRIRLDSYFDEYRKPFAVYKMKPRHLINDLTKDLAKLYVHYQIIRVVYLWQGDKINASNLQTKVKRINEKKNNVKIMSKDTHREKVPSNKT